MEGAPVKRRDFIKAIGIGCVSCCCNPLDALAKVNRSSGGPAGFLPGCSTRMGDARISPVRAGSLDGQTYDTEALLQQYDTNAQARRELYLPVFGEAEVDSILAEMRASYQALIPDIPYIGEKNFHLQWEIPNAEKLAEYLVAIKYGLTVQQFSKLYLDQAAKELYAIPEKSRRRIGKMQFSPLTQINMMMVAFRSQLRLYPEDYNLTYIGGDGKEFDWGFDYTQCSSDLLFKKYEATDLLIHLICQMDFIAGEALYAGYYRTMIIPEGAPMCDLRWKWEGAL